MNHNYLETKNIAMQLENYPLKGLVLMGYKYLISRI